MEVTLAWLPFEKEAIDRAERMELGGVELPVADDIMRLLRLHARRIDLDRVRDLVAQFAAALDDSERVENLERIIASINDEG